MKPIDFIEAYLPFAKETEAKSGINAIVILAQAALESGWGERAPGNMFFGVKASKDTPNEKKQLVTTTEYSKRNDLKFPEIISVTKQDNGLYKYKVRDWFRKYDTPEECFTEHCQFFFDNPRYAQALDVRYDAVSFAEEIAKAGYATDPNYAETLKAVIKSIQSRLK